MYPPNGTPRPLNVVTVPDFNPRLVPIRQNRSGQTGGTTRSSTSVLRSRWPLSTVNVATRAPLSTDYALVGGSFTERTLPDVSRAGVRGWTGGASEGA
jgi:hypothetical protein